MGILGDLASGYNTPLNAQQQVAYTKWRANLPQNLQNTSDYDLQGAFLGNAEQSARGHLTDTWKKPNHMTFSDGSEYSSQAEQGGHWADAAPGAPDSETHPWGYWASKANMQHHSPSELRDYFNQYEPNSSLVLPIQYTLPQNTRGQGILSTIASMFGQK